MKRLIRTAASAGALLLAGTGLCTAQSSVYGTGQPAPTSRYPDGTGDIAVDSLNAGQLDRNYRGPWHEIPADRVRPGYAAPAYASPAYPQGAHPQGAHPQGVYPQGVYPQGVYPQGAYAQPAYPPPPPGY